MTGRTGPSRVSGSIICLTFATYKKNDHKRNRNNPKMKKTKSYYKKRTGTSKSFIDVSELPVATNFPSELNFAHLATFWKI